MNIYDFIIDKEKHSIAIRREFSAELPLVWQAYTDAEILKQWWAPKPWTVKNKSMDFRENGMWHYAMVSPEGEEHWSLVRYHKIVPLELYEGTDGFCDADGNINEEMPQTRWTVHFRRMGGHTLVEKNLQFQNLAQLEKLIQMGFKGGISMTMDELERMFQNNAFVKSAV